MVRAENPSIDNWVIVFQKKFSNQTGFLVVFGSRENIRKSRKERKTDKEQWK